MSARISVYASIGFAIMLLLAAFSLLGQDYYQQKFKSTQSDLHYFPEDDSSVLMLSIVNFDYGNILINELEVTDPENEYVFPNGDTIVLVAEPEEGAVFLGWKDVSFNDTFEFIMEDDLSLVALFGSLNLLPESVDEELVLTNDFDAYYSQGPLTITTNGKLTIEAGLHILMSPGDSILVYGELTILGSEDFPVYLRSFEDNGWGCIRMIEGNTNLHYTEFVNCLAAVSTADGNLLVKNCTVYQSPYYYGDIFSIHHSNTVLENNLIYGPAVAGKSDVIDCDQISFGSILNNTIIGTTDDGIDIGTTSSNVVISGNRIYNCNSMGISIGENSAADVNYNRVVACEAGIQVHTGATAYIDHNTLFDNDVAIRCYHYPDEPNSGGHAIVTNTILSSSNLAVYELFANSSISIDYSLSDTEPIAGTGNLSSDPNFADTANLDFELLPDSPCIDSGDPSFPADSDGTRTDMGALFFDQSYAIPEYFQNLKVCCYPNPAVDHICFELMDKSETIQSIEIFDQSGKIILKKGNINSTFFRIDNISTLTGLYFATVLSSQNLTYECRFIVSYD
ncbi:MAG: right-handed parallel beta-helix repeat-containing protein [Bacteroidales bacterium]